MTGIYFWIMSNTLDMIQFSRRTPNNDFFCPNTKKSLTPPFLIYKLFNTQSYRVSFFINILRIL